jgi:hypothetical protein
MRRWHPDLHRPKACASSLALFGTFIHAFSRPGPPSAVRATDLRPSRSGNLSLQLSAGSFQEWTTSKPPTGFWFAFGRQSECGLDGDLAGALAGWYCPATAAKHSIKLVEDPPRSPIGANASSRAISTAVPTMLVIPSLSCRLKSGALYTRSVSCRLVQRRARREVV